ncbi:drug/metabolite transporter (DMT)-like permease [Sinobacterium caligoides]|uniref:Drug/metabolite transporter (DMT)-like permease n=1 Tax=Sinobacterium caligoides TaxID=933926 RepID=A0A3N2D568_9GAMM|nr:DMT family transporter [Sinobacterium caligoides]ROR94921.1 drug/metabolite transporter (DMT)-like permease [Sinobacterium caligoides]
MLNNFITNIPLSIRYMLMSALAFALMTSCVKLVHTYGIPVFEIVAARAIVSLFISYIDVKRKGISPLGNNRKLLLARGIAGSLALICVYYAVSTLPLAEATILQYLNPVFTAILAVLFLKERIKLSTIICIVCCIVGLLFIVAPGFTFDHTESLPLLSVTAALLGAFGSGIAYVIVKQLSVTEDSSVIVLYFPLIALPLSIILLGHNFVMPNHEALLLLLFVGLFTQVGQVGLTKAMQTEDASKTMAYAYIQVVFSIILGWLVFSEIPSLWTWIGGTLIISGAIINVVGSRKGKLKAA